MRTIDILTSQNVIINYELAEVRDRIFGWATDIIVMWVSILILMLCFVTTGIIDGDYFFYFIGIPILFFYHLAFEIFLDGQTPGKKAMGIKVVKLTGTEPSLNDYFVRWAFRPVDIIFSLGSIGIMLISSSEKGQRLGDVVANTTVIKLNPSQKIKLTDILNIKTLENYEPYYKDVRQLKEKDMLLLKEVMDRNIKYPNEAHKQAMEQAVEKVKEKINITDVPPDRILFIRTLIKDYVAMSR